MGPLPDRLWRRAIELFLVARSFGPGDGYLPELSTVAWLLHMTEEELTTDLRELRDRTDEYGKKAGVVQWLEKGWFVTNLAKRQATVSDKERQRRKRSRDRTTEDKGHADVTTRDLEAEAEAEEQKTEEQRVEAEADQPLAADTPIRDTLLISRRLAELGIDDPVRAELTASAWVTRKYINNWWEYVSSWPDATADVKLRSMIRRMQDRRQVPPEARDNDG